MELAAFWQQLMLILWILPTWHMIDLPVLICQDIVKIADAVDGATTNDKRGNSPN